MHPGYTSNPPSASSECPAVVLDETKEIIANIYCVGRNYADHISELRNETPTEPVVFLKSTAALRPLATGPLAFEGETFHYEAELVLLVGKEAQTPNEASWDSIKGVGLGIDLTRREVQTGLKAKGLPWTTAKSFRGSALVGPLYPTRYFADLTSIHFEFALNGTVKQRGDTKLMLYPVPEILRYLASLGPLQPGDLIYTGTPAGVGPCRKGDQLKLSFPAQGFSCEGVL